MFHKHQRQAFAVSTDAVSSIAWPTADRLNPGLLRARAEYARSLQVRQMLGQFGRYLTALALSRGRNR